MLTEKRILNQVTTLPQSDTVQVQWANQVLRDGEVISETYERNSYSQERKADFLAEVEGAENYITALGW